MGHRDLLTADGASSPLDRELRRGDLVGEYAVETRLGVGGMGQVYALIHPVIGKRAAAKVLHPELSRDHAAVARFVQEARAVNTIGHPNIIDIFGFGTLPDGRSYFLMERLQGESLRERLQRGRMGMGLASTILDALALALEAAHRAEIVHRDLKPDNVFLVRAATGGPQIKLLDFGIAKLLDVSEPRPQLTRAGSLVGTPAYMSPEQAGGTALDHRTDIYSLGVMAFEMLSGQLPFAQTSTLEMIASHLTQPPPSLREVAPAVPAEVADVVDRMLAKSPDERPPLAALRAAVHPYLATIDAPPAPSVGGVVPPTLMGTDHGVAPTVAPVVPDRPSAPMRGLAPSGPVPLVRGTPAAGAAPVFVADAVPMPPPPAIAPSRALRRGWIAVAIAIPLGVGLGVVVHFATRTPRETAAVAARDAGSAAVTDSPRPPPAAPIAVAPPPPDAAVPAPLVQTDAAVAPVLDAAPEPAIAVSPPVPPTRPHHTPKRSPPPPSTGSAGSAGSASRPLDLDSPR